ncbi:MAG TPA: nucleoside triphosphate hydrolase [Gammaproteobacteria bacterium]|nr:nucleoside triphosphate hydrolase [Gammaproteobacteria bacterium]
MLTHHRKLDRWLQPGGHADGQSDVLAVAMREAEEESGLWEIEPVSDSLFDIDIHLIPARGNEAEHFHYDCRFLLRSVGSDQYTVSEESDDLAWILLSDMASYTSEVSITRMVDKVRSYLTYL